MHTFIDSITQNRSLTSALQIIFLEDDPVDCELIEATLKNGGIEGEFIRINNRREFLESLNQRQPDLILADYVLPRFDGLEALEITKNICPQVPFILVSGVLGEEQAIEAMKQGAADYVLKQRLERLLPATQRAIRESRERQERQRVEIALKQTDDLLRAIVDESPVGIITLGRDRRVMTWNTAAEKLYGWSADAVVDLSLPTIPKSQQAACDFYFNQVWQGRTVSNQECQHLRQDGTLIDVGLSMAPLHDANDTIYGAVMVVRNITERKRTEAQRLNLLEQEVIAQEAVESANLLKDEFLAVLSHELRTPLNAIVGWIKLIQRGNVKPAVLQKALATIERNAIAQTQLVEDLLDISCIMQGQISLHIQSVDVNVLIRATIDTLRPAIEAKSIHVSHDLALDVGLIAADLNRLQQVVWNLLSNAIKFTPASGHVRISSKVVEGRLQIQIADSGIGIAPNFLPHIFDYFRQADSSFTRSQGGLGLGLAITRRLVELHGGTIHSESPGPNQGTTFTVNFPRRTAPADSQINSMPAVTMANLQGIKVLVVDDEADSRELIAVVLEQAGAQIERAESAQAGLAVLENFQPHLIISDIGMPEIDGYDFLRMARSSDNRRLSDVPAIALTAYAREEDRQQASIAGYQTHIAKPFDIQELVNVVYQLIHPTE
ncbi:MAG: response regulator [Leptolyngbyaceae cyanobacterium]